MDDINLDALIDKSLNFFDGQNKKYKEYLKEDDITFNRDINSVKFNNLNKEFKYEVLGMFDNTTNIWMWGWMIPQFLYNETNLVRKLLNYGLKITPSVIIPISDEKLYLKTQMLNSRFLLKEKFQLDLHLAISSYLVKDNIKFIYNKKKYLNKDKTKYITLYYFIY
jgi:hypothetical protein